jgi:hypothetical protein
MPSTSSIVEVDASSLFCEYAMEYLREGRG